MKFSYLGERLKKSLRKTTSMIRFGVFAPHEVKVYYDKLATSWTKTQ